MLTTCRNTKLPTPLLFPFVFGGSLPAFSRLFVKLISISFSNCAGTMNKDFGRWDTLNAKQATSKFAGFVILRQMLTINS